MAAFSYQEEHHQYPPYLLDSAIRCIPSSSSSSSSFFPFFFSLDDGGSSGSSSHCTAANAPSADDKHLVFSLPSPTEAHDDDDDDDKAPNLQEQVAAVDGKKRTGVDETDQSKDNTNGVISKSRKQIKRPRGVTKKAEEKKQKSSKACSNPSDGYVHVRARRGQATDSHSLAERVRREKISERMKMLQGLVPGCEKVTGKALMLDEIINYVQSLQNQVEFLSMKIASLSPVLYDFKVDFVDCTDQPQKVLRSIPQALPSVEQANHLQAKAFDNGTTSYQVMDHSTPHLMHVQGPTLSFSQDHVGTALQVGAQRQGFQDQLEFLSMCPFQ